MIRRSTPDDAGAIRHIHLAAFPSPAEADLVERLGQDGDAVISLIAEQGGDVFGHVLLSRMAVEGDGRPWRALGLGPVAVLPHRRRGGIGGALIEASLELARQEGEEIVFLLGDPAYYGRFGFTAEAAAPFASPYSGPYFMASKLADAPLPLSGRADYPRAFAGLPG